MDIHQVHLVYVHQPTFVTSMLVKPQVTELIEVCNSKTCT